MKKVKVMVGRVNAGTYVYSVVMMADEVPFGLNGTGKTIEEAKQDFMEAYREIKEIMAENGLKNFKDVSDVPTRVLQSILDALKA